MLTLPKALTEAEIEDALKLSRKPWTHQLQHWQGDQLVLERGLRWDMGTGKTLEAVGFLRLKYRAYGAIGPTLILAPLATMGGWKKTFDAEAPEAVRQAVAICAGFGKKKLPGKKRAAMIADPANKIIVTNFASLTMPDVLAALQAKGFQYLVVDEIDEFKGFDSKRLKNLLTISDRCAVRLGMTGTMLTNKLFDVWGPMRILDKGKRLGTNFYSHFRRKYFEDVNAGNPYANWPEWVLKKGSKQEVSEKLAEVFTDVQKSQCMSLPPRVVMREDVELSEEQQKAYAEMEEHLVAYASEGEATATIAITKMLRMRQILSGYMALENVEDPGERSVKYLPNPRLERLHQLLEQLTPGNKVVVWSNFTALYPKMRELATELGVGFAELTGETKDRQGEIDRFVNDPECRIFFSNPQAGGVGVDGLQHVASYCIYYDRTHSLRHYLQSRDRIHRGGSEVHAKITEIHLVAPNTLDSEILDVLEAKEDFAEDVLNRVRSMYGRRTKVEG